MGLCLAKYMTPRTIETNTEFQQISKEQMAARELVPALAGTLPSISEILDPQNGYTAEQRKALFELRRGQHVAMGMARILGYFDTAPITPADTSTQDP
jgi:hypothetical protein